MIHSHYHYSVGLTLHGPVPRNQNIMLLAAARTNSCLSVCENCGRFHSHLRLITHYCTSTLSYLQAAVIVHGVLTQRG